MKFCLAIAAVLGSTLLVFGAPIASPKASLSLDEILDALWAQTKSGKYAGAYVEALPITKRDANAEAKSSLGDVSKVTLLKGWDPETRTYTKPLNKRGAEAITADVTQPRKERFSDFKVLPGLVLTIHRKSKLTHKRDVAGGDVVQPGEKLLFDFEPRPAGSTLPKSIHSKPKPSNGKRSAEPKRTFVFDKNALRPAPKAGNCKGKDCVMYSSTGDGPTTFGLGSCNGALCGPEGYQPTHNPVTNDEDQFIKPNSENQQNENSNNVVWN